MRAFQELVVGVEVASVLKWVGRSLSCASTRLMMDLIGSSAPGMVSLLLLS